DEAWISVKVRRDAAVGTVQVFVREMPDDPQAPQLAGTILERSFAERLKEAFFADAMRFPSYGGRTVKVGKTYEIVVGAVRNISRNGAIEQEPVLKTVYKGNFASRAIVDFGVSL